MKRTTINKGLAAKVVRVFKQMTKSGLRNRNRENGSSKEHLGIKC